MGRIKDGIVGAEVEEGDRFFNDYERSLVSKAFAKALYRDCFGELPIGRKTKPYVESPYWYPEVYFEEWGLDLIAIVEDVIANGRPADWDEMW